MIEPADIRLAYPEGWHKPEWRRHALCGNLDVIDLFYSPDFEGFHSEPAREKRWRQMQAKKVCARCPVLEPCREYVDQEEGGKEDIHGIWAGETEHERKLRRRRERRRKRCGG